MLVPQTQANKDERHANIMERCDPSDLDVIDEPCTATVAEFERCVRDTISETRSYFATLSCERPMGGVDGKMIASASCGAVDNDCWP